MVSLPGAMTPTEILTVHNAGADFVKVFLQAILDLPIKALKGPLNHIAIGGWRCILKMFRVYMLAETL